MYTYTYNIYHVPTNLKTETACITHVNHSKCLEAKKKKGNTTMHVEYKFVCRPSRDNPLNAQTLSFATRTKKKKKKKMSVRLFPLSLPATNRS